MNNFQQILHLFPFRVSLILSLIQLAVTPNDVFDAMPDEVFVVSLQPTSTEVLPPSATLERIMVEYTGFSPVAAVWFFVLLGFLQIVARVSRRARLFLWALTSAVLIGGGGSSMNPVFLIQFVQSASLGTQDMVSFYLNPAIKFLEQNAPISLVNIGRACISVWSHSLASLHAELWQTGHLSGGSMPGLLRCCRSAHAMFISLCTRLASISTLEVLGALSDACVAMLAVIICWAVIQYISRIGSTRTHRHWCFIATSVLIVATAIQFFLIPEADGCLRSIIASISNRAPSLTVSFSNHRIEVNFTSAVCAISIIKLITGCFRFAKSLFTRIDGRQKASAIRGINSEQLSHSRGQSAVSSHIWDHTTLVELPRFAVAHHLDHENTLVGGGTATSKFSASHSGGPNPLTRSVTRIVTNSTNFSKFEQFLRLTITVLTATCELVCTSVRSKFCRIGHPTSRDVLDRLHQTWMDLQLTSMTDHLIDMVCGGFRSVEVPIGLPAVPQPTWTPWSLLVKITSLLIISWAIVCATNAPSLAFLRAVISGKLILTVGFFWAYKYHGRLPFLVSSSEKDNLPGGLLDSASFCSDVFPVHCRETSLDSGTIFTLPRSESSLDLWIKTIVQNAAADKSNLPPSADASVEYVVLPTQPESGVSHHQRSLSDIPRSSRLNHSLVGSLLPDSSSSSRPRLSRSLSLVDIFSPRQGFVDAKFKLYGNKRAKLASDADMTPSFANFPSSACLLPPKTGSSTAVSVVSSVGRAPGRPTTPVDLEKSFDLSEGRSLPGDESSLGFSRLRADLQQLDDERRQISQMERKALRSADHRIRRVRRDINEGVEALRDVKLGIDVLVARCSDLAAPPLAELPYPFNSTTSVKSLASLPAESSGYLEACQVNYDVAAMDHSTVDTFASTSASTPSSRSLCSPYPSSLDLTSNEPSDVSDDLLSELAMLRAGLRDMNHSRDRASRVAAKERRAIGRHLKSIRKGIEEGGEIAKEVRESARAAELLHLQELEEALEDVLPAKPSFLWLCDEPLRALDPSTDLVFTLSDLATSSSTFFLDAIDSPPPDLPPPVVEVVSPSESDSQMDMSFKSAETSAVTSLFSRLLSYWLALPFPLTPSFSLFLSRRRFDDSDSMCYFSLIINTLSDLIFES
ncbi:hypothetical protein JAAARDRAFT_189738 [Jaapia argillacea MUCL 33604]|uniref:Uncharacterized protein n=1 Tax=Jaapia argillacea MUCL 33604 TaxID=933084 RepID=A0A067QII7_9AGAM|nr:hypothetical protein JAAARDRAFT_189738 [Jaapia argillacea MUCL 33604]